VTRIGEMRRSVTFQQKALDADDRRTGDWADVVTRDAKIVPLRGGEAVAQQRLQGAQPVIIIVRRDDLTAAIDNSFRALDARNTALIWGVTSVIWNEAEDMIEVQAVQRPGGSDE
jgi:head-tail adaptor